MKITRSIFAIAAAGLILTSCNETAKSPDASAAAEANATTETVAVKTETASFSIEGMSCAVGCAKTIEKELAKMDGVQKASVDFENKSAVVKYDAAKQSPEKIVEAVEASADGKTYKVSNVKSSADQAMVYGDPKKDKKKKKAGKEAEKTQKEGCATDAGAGAKPACCAAKKACHAEEKGTL